MKSSIWVALWVTLGLTVWVLSGALTAQSTADPAAVSQKSQLRIKVQTQVLQAQAVKREVVLQGQLEPLRRVDIRAETDGQIKQLLVDKGQRVAAGAVLMQLRMDTRQASLNEAQALLRQRQKELEALQKLKQQGLQAENNLFAAQTALASAQAAVAQIELDIEHTKIRAPFAGVVNQRPVEVGNFLQRGEMVAEVVDDAVLKIVGQIPQQQIAQVHLGQTVQAELLNGAQLQGKVSYIAAVAEVNTRSFRVEITAPNPQKFLAGASVTLRIWVDTQQGHFISPAMMALNDVGELGVKAVDDSQRVQFYAIDILRTQTDGAWVTGLPQQVQLITLGQGFVKAGELVETVAGS